MFLLGFLLGSVMFGIPAALFGLKLNKINKVNNAKPKYVRRGIYHNSYSVKNAGVKNGSIDVQFEIGELESTDFLSKVEVISCVADQSQYNDEYHRKKFTDLVNGMWINSEKIEWITTVASKRNDKIDQILG